MDTRITQTLIGTAITCFEKWAKASNIPWAEEGVQGDFIAYVVCKRDVMSCNKLSPYLIELQQAFKDNPNFDSITLDVA